MILLFGLGSWEIAVILLLVLLIFGAKRIPEVARGLGKGIREFRSATSEISRELTLEDRPPAYRPPASQQGQNYASQPPSQGTSQSTNPTPPSQ
ncbi:MAG: twin-arginine translocase TatA/TatE family subunit [Bacteroidetes bacterium]|nr:twin-arginine translocase TatA/TatE family subunit [Bacteroidota bacterium]